jgi:hypothetical protein
MELHLTATEADEFARDGLVKEGASGRYVALLGPSRRVVPVKVVITDQARDPASWSWITPR